MVAILFNIAMMSGRTTETIHQHFAITLKAMNYGCCCFGARCFRCHHCCCCCVIGCYHCTCCCSTHHCCCHQLVIHNARSVLCMNMIGIEKYWQWSNYLLQMKAVACVDGGGVFQPSCGMMSIQFVVYIQLAGGTVGAEITGIIHPIVGETIKDMVKDDR